MANKVETGTFNRKPPYHMDIQKNQNSWYCPLTNKEVIWSQAIAMHISAQEIDSLISDNNDFCHSRELYC